MQELNNILSFKGKRVLITGASSGIGKQVAIRFAEAGAHVMTVNRKPDDAAKEYLKGASDVSLFKADLGVKADIDKLWDSISDDELPDVLINNAGIYPMKNFEEVDQEFLQKVLDVNLTSMFWMCQHFIMRRKDVQKGGIMVNTSSIEAQTPFTENLIPYGISKAGVVALTRGIAREYGDEGFRANVVMPGAIVTEEADSKKWEIFMKLRFDMIKAGINMKKHLPNGEFGTADDIAKATLFLASDMSCYVQGEVLKADGGFSTM